MTIKELCTKVREAAEAIPGITPWQSVPAHVAEGPSQVRVRTPSEDWLLCELPGDGYAAFVATVNPSVALALLGRIEELEKALTPFADAYRKHDDPGVSDLYDEQPVAWHVELGAYRAARRLVR